MKISKNSRKILEKRYLIKKDGKPIEEPLDMFKRIAKAVANAETKFDDKKTDTKTIENKFLNIMTNWDFLPNSPTLMNAGRELGQLSACFVLPVEDSMDDIFTAVKNAALIHKSGGGTGFTFSHIRPKNNPVKSTGGVASGPVSFMKVFNAATEAIKQGGTRRGANMGILRVDHPDILEFISCKQDTDELTNFNISIGLTAEFIDALKNNGYYDLKFNGKIYNRYKAKEIFDKIIERAWSNGEPGIVFLDRLNSDNPTPELADIEATNPCVTKDTWVMTSEGPKQVEQLIGKDHYVYVNGKAYKTTEDGFFKTGCKNVYKISTKEGYQLRLTEDHPVCKVIKETRNQQTTSWVKVRNLKFGDKLLINNHENLKWNGKGNEDEGYLLGLLIGDGTVKENEAVISVWNNGTDGHEGIIRAASTATESLHHRADFKGFQKEITGRNEKRLKLKSIFNLASDYKITSNKNITKNIEYTSSDFYCGFLKGLFDSDGSVQGTQNKGISIRLAQSDLKRLSAVQRMLLRLGIASKIYKERRLEQNKLLPDGKGGNKYYFTKAQHELIISGKNIEIFNKRIGFFDSDKQNKLNKLLSSYKRSLNKERFTVTYQASILDGKEDVYDVQVPGPNAFDANGFYVHNCGEQPLLPYEACNLGSINLSNMVVENDIDWDKLEDTINWSVRFLDNVVEINNFPLKKIEEVVLNNRKIGLGIMGWANLLFKLRIPYDSERSIELAKKVMGFIKEASDKASKELAKIRGNFPNIEYSIFKEDIMRNATRTTIAPTGTISMIAETSSGVEPVFALAYTKNVMDGENLVEVNPVLEEYIKDNYNENEAKNIIDKVAEEGSVQNISAIPEDIKKVFITALEIKPEWHIKMQAAFQKYCDNAVSKTVNFPYDAAKEDVEKVYMLAYELGCKGVTVYRSGSRQGDVYKKGSKKTEAVAVTMDKITPRPRPKRTYGVTEQVKTGCGKMYITVNYDKKGMIETFITTGSSGGCSGFTEGISRMISLALRADIAPEAIIDQLTSVSCPTFLRKKAMNPSIKGKSCPDIIGKILAKELEINKPDIISDEDINLLLQKTFSQLSTTNTDEKDWDNLTEDELIELGICPDCKRELIFSEGCLKCDCGFSRCG